MTFLFHISRLLNLGKYSSQDIFKSRQLQNTDSHRLSFVQIYGVIALESLIE